MSSSRPSQMDVSNSVDVTDHRSVRDAVGEIVEGMHPEYDFGALARLFEDFNALYEGRFPGFHGCDIHYHNQQHVLDVTLAMARLMDGSRRSGEGQPALSPESVLAGVAAALFHDSGYIRRIRDTRHKNGAAYTHIHVSRSARFMQEYFPTVGLESLVGVCSRIVHFTSYLLDPADIAVESEEERHLGELLGSADLIAQMADADYLEKLRTHLYAEFEAGGMAGEGAFRTHTGTIYRSPEHLMELTPSFIRSSIESRLDGFFGGAHRLVAAHFGGRNLYLEAIHGNCDRLEALLAAGG